MSEGPNCHNCHYLDYDYDATPSDLTFLYSCLFQKESKLTTFELRKGECHFRSFGSGLVESYRLVRID